MLPAVVGAVGLGLGAYQSVGQLMDNRRYWNDYRKNTGISNRYYWKSGVGDWTKFGSRAFMSVYAYRGLYPRDYSKNFFITNRITDRHNYYDFKTYNRYGRY